MRVFVTTLVAILRSILRSRAAVELENLALRHQIGVLQRYVAKRLKLTSGDRLLRWPSSSQKRSWPGIVPAFDCSGLGRCGAASLDDPSFRTRSEI
jgi:hypothetical protein